MWVSKRKTRIYQKKGIMMACMEHSCNKCEYIWINNKWEAICPKCGSLSVSNDYDEVEYE